MFLTNCQKNFSRGKLEHTQVQFGDHYYEVFEKDCYTLSVIHSPDCDCFIRLGYDLESFNGE